MKIEIIFSDVDKETRQEIKKTLNASYEKVGGQMRMYIFSHKTDKQALKTILKNKSFGKYGVNIEYSDAYIPNRMPQGIYIFTKRKSKDCGKYTWCDTELTCHYISFKFSKSSFFSDAEIEAEKRDELDKLDDIFS